MVKNNRQAVKKSPKAAAPGKGSGGKSPKGPPPKGQGPLNTSKGQFTFTMVTDGCYVEHKVREQQPVLQLNPINFALLDLTRVQTCVMVAVGPEFGPRRRAP